MCSHGHSHGGGCSAEADDMAHAEEGMRYDLWMSADMDRVTCLNEVSDGSGKNVLKSMENRMDRSAFLESDADEELLLHIPFAGHVKITGMVIAGEVDEGMHPARVRVYKDRPTLTFEDCSLEAEQEIDLKQDPNGVTDYVLRASKFGQVNHLSLHFPSNFGGDVTRIYYIGLRGEFIGDFRAKAVIATYESRPMSKDHKGEIPDAVGRTMF